ncbi:hypothetical protein FWK35_00009152 [Aphis craccivora]|uniref:Uncharacterized protein n=1 Tax=Aphis craccivora TaxID=307492 RepID=A0A6G0Z236_APHCR|nr:hypothetical protein FWK35_00009152 [Aphis craccivora]
MSAIVTCPSPSISDIYFKYLKAISPVPPATSNNRVRGLGSNVFINSSFHNLCTPQLITSFIASYESATFLKT